MNKKKELSQDSTIREVFDIIEPEDGTIVVPVRLTELDDERQRIMFMISGKKEESNLLLANLMTYVDHMYAAAQQMEANEEATKSDIAHIIS